MPFAFLGLLLVAGSSGGSPARTQEARAAAKREAAFPGPRPRSRTSRRLDDEELQAILDNEPAADRAPWIIEHERLARLFTGDVKWNHTFGSQRLRWRCDRLLLVAPHALEKHRRPSEDRPGDGPGASAADGNPEAKPEPPVPPGRVELYGYAEGNVRMTLEREKTTILAESVYFEQRRDGSVASLLRRARILTSFAGMRQVVTSVQLRDLRHTAPHPRGEGFETLPLSVQAEELFTSDFERFSARRVRVSTCDYEVPHYALGADRMDVSPVGEAGDRDYVINLEGTRFRFAGREITPLPVDHWDTRWHDYFPVRSVEAGQSGKFGVIAGVDWNVNFLLGLVPGWRGTSLRRYLDRSRIDFETTWFSERGLGWGPKWEYGTAPSRWLPWQVQNSAWNWYGEGRYFAIRDHGADRNAKTPFPDPDRDWTNLYHRQAIPHLGTLDLEYSKFSDPRFPTEYFESFIKQEKRQESLLSLRRNLRDNLALTGLAKVRVNDFESEVERLPEAKLLLLQQPVAGTGLYTDLTLQAANLRDRPADSLAVPSRRLGRFDALNEWAYPIDWLDPWLDARPFATLRWTGWEEPLDANRGAVDRGAFGGGVRLSQSWSRSFDFEDGSLFEDWFGIDRLKHVVVPEVGYFNLYARDLAPEDLVEIDDVDSVDLRETVSLSLRQALVTRREVEARERRPGRLGGRPRFRPREYDTREVLDSEVSFVLFPHAARDNESDHVSRVIFDHTLRPSAALRLRSWVAVDPEEGFDVDIADNSLSVAWPPGVLTTTLGDRFTRRPENPDLQTHFLYGLFTLNVGEKWKTQVFLSRDIEQQRDSEYGVSLVRVFHRFALYLEFSVDPGEGYNQTYSVNFAPLGLVHRLMRNPRRR